MKKSKLFLLLSLLASSTFLASCDGFDVSSIKEKLFPVPYDALAVFLAFIVLLVVVFFFAYKPVKNLLKKRADYVEGKIKEAEKKENEANVMLTEAKIEVKEMKAEALSIVENARVDALKEKENILNDAALEREAQLKKTKQEIAQEIEANKDEIHREIVSVAIGASSKILEREITEKDNEKIIDNFIDDLKDKE